MKYTLITLTALSGAAFGQNLVTNGDFSDTSGMTSNGTYFTGVPNGWTSNNGNVEVITPAYGSNSAGFTSNYIDVVGPEAITISQQVNGFTAGQQYTLSYDWGNRNHAPYDMTISMGDGSASHIGSGIATSSNNSFTFTASAATETLSVAYNYTNGNSVTGFNSTNFTVTAVPEPSSAALLGLGGLTLILRRRK